MSTKCQQTLYFLPFLGDTFCMVFYSIFKRKKENGKGHYWYYCYTDPVRNVRVQKRCLGCATKREAYAMYVRVFFSLAKSADKPSAAGLALHAVRLIPRVVFALITD